MKRPLLSLVLALAPFVFVSCDRDTRVDSILSVGVNLAATGVTPGGSGNWENSFDDTAIRQQEMIRAQRLTHQLAQLTDRLERYRGQSDSDTGHLDTQISELHNLVDQLASEQAFDPRLMLQAEELRLSILAEAARRQPSAFKARLQAESRRVMGRPFATEEHSKASVQRFVTDHLCAATTDEVAAVSLVLHALTYPECEPNVDLYVTLVDRLVNEGQVVTAIALARQGLQHSGSEGNAVSLRERLKRLYADHRGAVGTPMDFAGPTRRNQELQLAELRGTPVVVVFWASWCPACRAEIPEFNRLQQRYSRDRVRFVGVSLDSSAPQFDKYVRAENVGWPQLFTARQGQTAWKNPIAKYYGIRSIPTSFLVDEKGLIVAAGIHQAARIESTLESYLAGSDGESKPTSLATADVSRGN